MIRDARVDDWPQLAKLGERLVLSTPYRDIQLDRERCLHTYGLCMSSALGFAKVSEQNGKVTGVLLGVVDRLWWAKSRYASDLVFYCEDGKSGLPLLRSFVDWAWSVSGVTEITCAQSSGVNMPRMAVLYRRVGFEQVGGLWTQTR